MWYLAAPFFNPAQVALVERIEQLFEHNCVELFSPRKHPANTSGKPIDADTAEDIFNGNIEGIQKARGVLAVLDYLLPEPQQLRLVAPATIDDSEHAGSVEVFRPASGPLALPDSGTVWEMGHAYAMMDIVGFTTNPHARLNLMLTQSCSGVLCGFGRLATWVADKCMGDVPKWTGKLI